MKESENEKYVYLNWEDAIKMDPDQIMTKLMFMAHEMNCVPFDVSYKGYPNVYLRGAFDVSFKDPLSFDLRFVMFVKEK